MKIEILMATYNGGLYIENQILSLLAQSHKNWRLIIHDDGSQDETIKIIENYKAIDSRIVLVEDGIKFGNAASNFMHLLQLSEAEFIIFCDQDDIWFENKLMMLYTSLYKEEEACAVYCNAYAYNGQEITSNKVTLLHRNSLNNSLFLNSGVQGCSMMFNRKLLEKINIKPDFVCMHDHFVTIGAVTFGTLKYIDHSLMFYRQHNNNVTGNVPTNLFQRIKTFLDFNNPILDKQHYEAIHSFYLVYADNMRLSSKLLFEEYLKYPRVNLFQRISIVFRNSFTIGESSLILLLKTLIRKPI